MCQNISFKFGSLSRTVKDLRFYPTCRLTSWPLKFHGYGQKTRDFWSETKDFITLGIADSMSFNLHLTH